MLSLMKCHFIDIITIECPHLWELIVQIIQEAFLVLHRNAAISKGASGLASPEKGIPKNIDRER